MYIEPHSRISNLKAVIAAGKEIEQPDLKAAGVKLTMKPADDLAARMFLSKDVKRVLLRATPVGEKLLCSYLDR